MSITNPDTLSLGKMAGKRLFFQPAQSHCTSDAGLLVLAQFDRQLRLTQQFADALEDHRLPAKIDHSFLEMVRMRIFGILADYPDQNDHDVLRSDPAFKLVAGRDPDDNDLASQPTLSRFENNIDVPSLRRLEDVFIEQFIASYDEPPSVITLDVDPFDDPTHGQQQLAFYHGYYRQYQLLPRLITCAENDAIVMACLLFGTAHAALGIEDDLTRLTARLREAFPDVVIRIRADSGFGVPAMYDVCERLDILYTVGIAMNATLKRLSDEAMQAAQRRFDETGEPQRDFCAFWYKAGSWSSARRTIVKVEVNALGTNRRAIVTNRPGAFHYPGPCYDEYTERGESENRNKEMKRGFQADRLSDHRYMANLFRLYLHAAAANLLVRLRRMIAAPPESDPESLPIEAMSEQERRRYFNRRRERDPLGEGHPCTWRSRFIKVGATLTVSVRRIVVRLSSSWPYLGHIWQVGTELKSHFPALEFR